MSGGIMSRIVVSAIMYLITITISAYTLGQGLDVRPDEVRESYQRLWVIDYTDTFTDQRERAFFESQAEAENYKQSELAITNLEKNLPWGINIDGPRQVTVRQNSETGEFEIVAPVPSPELSQATQNVQALGKTLTWLARAAALAAAWSKVPAARPWLDTAVNVAEAVDQLGRGLESVDRAQREIPRDLERAIAELNRIVSQLDAAMTRRELLTSGAGRLGETLALLASGPADRERALAQRVTDLDAGVQRVEGQIAWLREVETRATAANEASGVLQRVHELVIYTGFDRLLQHASAFSYLELDHLRPLVGGLADNAKRQRVAYERLRDDLARERDRYQQARRPRNVESP